MLSLINESMVFLSLARNYRCIRIDLITNKIRYAEYCSNDQTKTNESISQQLWIVTAKECHKIEIRIFFNSKIASV